jgi:hypothetical protein
LFSVLKFARYYPAESGSGEALFAEMPNGLALPESVEIAGW